MANDALKPENMMNYEVSVGRHFSHWFEADITAFFSQGSDMIQTVDMKNVNTGSFINKGLEFSARSHPLDCLQLWATYSYLHSSVRNLTAAPRNMYYLGIGWDAFRNFHADFQLKGVGGLYVSDDMPRQSYAVANVRLSYQLISMLQLFADLDNITDTDYVINRGYRMPGFNAMGGFKFKF